ncbi:MAG: hypothetical protein BGN86_13490 [Caulobacterales bacterium 68-7]|nr:MAG: hypothetical protein BGN86_13490 [Caulobacterales bacterium 68-7]
MIRRPLAALRKYLGRENGVAAAEIAIWSAALIAPIFGTVDLANYMYRRMQVNTAAQAAAQRAWILCNTAAKLPAVQNCSGLSAAATGAAQSTNLGTAVTISSTNEGFYCANSSGALVQVGSTGTYGSNPARPSPNTCASVTTGSTAVPGDYIVVTTSYTYSRLFGNLALSGLLPTSVTRTAWMRLS